MKAIIWKMAVLTVLGILSFSAMIMTAVWNVAGNYDPTVLIYSFLAALVTWVVVKTIIRLNLQYQEIIKLRMRTPTEFIDEWECPEHEWHYFVEEQQVAGKKRARTTGLVAGGLTGLFFGFVFWSDGMAQGIRAGLLAAIGVGGFIYLLAIGFANVKFKKFAKSRTGKVVISKQAISVNDSIFDWSNKKSRLDEVTLDESFQCPVILFTIEQNAGSRSNFATHVVPVPKAKLNEAKKIMEYFIANR